MVYSLRRRHGVSRSGGSGYFLASLIAPRINDQTAPSRDCSHPNTNILWITSRPDLAVGGSPSPLFLALCARVGPLVREGFLQCISFSPTNYLLCIPKCGTERSSLLLVNLGSDLHDNVLFI